MESESIIQPFDILPALKEMVEELRIALANYVKAQLEIDPEDPSYDDFTQHIETLKTGIQNHVSTIETLEGNNSSPTTPNGTEADRDRAGRSKWEKEVAQTFKLYSNMKMTKNDVDKLDVYWKKFERVVVANNLKPDQAKKLLSLFAHEHERIAQWVTRHHELNPECNIKTLKDDLLKDFVSPYWKTKTLTLIFNIEYKQGETVPAFIGRFQELLIEKDIPFTVPDPRYDYLKELLFSKLPDSVKRVLNSKPLSEYDTLLSLMTALKLFPGIPTDITSHIIQLIQSERTTL
ncbi:hypothetical protein ROZALSC1DRAFT_30849, partial [Rozella allomycis CSF55]